MSGNYTATDLARILGRNARTVQRQCQQLGLGNRVGRYVVYSDADLALLRDYSPRLGNPEMIAGNRLWQRRKKSDSPT